MKNIDKYSETKDALEAYEEYRDGRGVLPLSQWLECEYEEPIVNTFLEAAESVCEAWENWNNRLYSLEDKIRNLRSFIEREKRKPVRNFDKYETAKDAFVGFNKMCSDKHCDRCPFNSERNESERNECPICKLNWLYAEAEK